MCPFLEALKTISGKLFWGECQGPRSSSEQGHSLDVLESNFQLCYKENEPASFQGQATKAKGATGTGCNKGNSK